MYKHDIMACVNDITAPETASRPQHSISTYILNNDVTLSLSMYILGSLHLQNFNAPLEGHTMAGIYPPPPPPPPLSYNGHFRSK